MLNKGATLTFLAVSLIGMNVLFFRAVIRRRNPDAPDGVYQYAREYRSVFLFGIPVFVGMLVVIAFSDRQPPHGTGLIEFSAMAIAVLSMPLLGYAYARRYRVTVDARGVTVRSLFRTKFVAFSEISAIATLRGRGGVDYCLYASSGACIAKIGGSVENFESLQFDVESGVQSKLVTLYEWDLLHGWQQRTNAPQDDWRNSAGPELIRDRNRRINIEMLVGAVLVVTVALYVHFFMEG